MVKSTGTGAQWKSSLKGNPLSNDSDAQGAALSVDKSGNEVYVPITLHIDIAPEVYSTAYFKESNEAQPALIRLAYKFSELKNSAESSTSASVEGAALIGIRGAAGNLAPVLKLSPLDEGSYGIKMNKFSVTLNNIVDETADVSSINFDVKLSRKMGNGKQWTAVNTWKNANISKINEDIAYVKAEAGSAASTWSYMLELNETGGIYTKDKTSSDEVKCVLGSGDSSKTKAMHSIDKPINEYWVSKTNEAGDTSTCIYKVTQVNYGGDSAHGYNALISTWKSAEDAAESAGSY